MGFRTTEVVRTVADGVTRRLTLSVWYPAGPARGGARAMTVGDLFRVVLDEGQLAETDGLPLERAVPAAMTGDPNALSVETARSVLAAPTLASPDPPAAGASFPVVLWGVRHATVLAQAPMAEALASRGMVVATVWSSDPPLAFLWEDRSEADKRATIEAHVLDLEHALAVIREEPIVDGTRVVVLAWSYGGQTAARVQARDPAVRAVISLDANVVPARPEEQLNLRRPLVYFVGQDTTRRGYERLDRVPPPWLAVRLPELAHGNFNALEGFLPALYAADTVFPWSRGGPVARDGYAALVRMVAAVAVAFTDDSPPTMATLAEQVSAAAGSLTVEARHAEPR